MTRGEVVAKHLPAIAAAIVDTGAKPRPDWLLADELRLHAEELLSAANLIDRPWIDRTRDLLAQTRLGEPVTLRDLLDTLDGWPDLDGAGEARADALRQALAATGLAGREAVEALLMEVADA